MYEMVTARVPAEIRRQGNAMLKSLGATPTQLVNAAYEYLLNAGSLPSAQGTGARTAQGETAPVQRRLSDEARRELTASIEASTLDVPQSFWTGRSYKDIIAEGRLADYEALA